MKNVVEQEVSRAQIEKFPFVLKEDGRYYLADTRKIAIAHTLSKTCTPAFSLPSGFVISSRRKEPQFLQHRTLQAFFLTRHVLKCQVIISNVFVVTGGHSSPCSLIFLVYPIHCRPYILRLMDCESRIFSHVYSIPATHKSRRDRDF